MKPLSKEAYILFQEGAKAIADIEQNGMRIDVPYCEKTEAMLGRKIRHLKNKLEDFEEGKMWKQIYGGKYNMGSAHQLGKILFEHFDYEVVKETDTGLPCVDNATLTEMNKPFLNALLNIRKLEKAKETYIHNFLVESVDGILHPFFHLNRVVTFRSSSSSPNFQNYPKRDAYYKKLIRSAVIPRDKNFVLGGADFSGIEVRIAYAYHKDPTMYEYLIDPTKDMHRDTAQECFFLADDEWTKACRNYGKGFVFAQFYGDYYVNCAKLLWECANKEKTKKSIPLRQHLKSHGIKTYNQFENHIQEVENSFWNVRFPVYTEWKEKWYADYIQKGYFESLTGFKFSGLYSRNQVINYAVQGSAFHCLLFCLAKLNTWMKKEKLRSMIIGQIHDEINTDLHRDEVDYVYTKMTKIMEHDLVEEFDWINVPMGVEFGLSPIGGTWADVAEVVNVKSGCSCGFKWLYKKGNGYECPSCKRFHNCG